MNPQAYTLFAPPHLFHALSIAPWGRVARHRYLVFPCAQKTAEC